MTELKAIPLTGSLAGYFRASHAKYAAYGLTAKEAESILSVMIKTKEGLK